MDAHKNITFRKRKTSLIQRNVWDKSQETDERGLETDSLVQESQVFGDPAPRNLFKSLFFSSWKNNETKNS